MTTDARQLARRFAVLSLLSWLPAGLTMAALVLLPQARGLTLTEVGWLFAVYGAVTLTFELPTGGLADALGRRPVLLAATALRTAALVGFAVAPGLGSLLAATALMAFSRALGSGPLEAWYVDEALRLDPAVDLQRGIARGRSAEAVGLSIGSVTGGLLPLLGGGLDARGGAPVLALSLPVLASAAVSGLSLVPVWLLVREHRRTHARTAWHSAWASVPGAVRGGIGTAARDAVLRRVMLTMLMLGVTLVTAELLMPTQLAESFGDPEAAAAAYGALATAGFLGTALGAALAPAVARALRGGPRATVLLLVLGAAATSALAGPWVVLGMAGYVALYLCIGGADALLAETVHRRVRSDQRATVLSTQSLVQQLGGLGGNLVIPAVAASATLSAGWLLGAAATLLAGLVLVRLPVREAAPALQASPG